MADSIGASPRRSPQGSSFIPLVSPRPIPARSALPSSLSLPQLTLAPPSRQKTPTNGSPSSNSSASPNSSGISSLRSLRNFLPFGQKQPSSDPKAAGPSSKNQISHFGMPRRASSSHNERRSISSYARLGHEDREPPVILIQSRRSEQVPRSQFVRSMPGPDLDKSLPPPPPVPVRPETGPPVIDSTIIPLGTDLSTILESETSGISKHIPPLDDSQEETARLPKFSTPADSSILQGPPSSGRQSSGPESDGMDLSTSELRNEVMDALKQNGAGKNWNNEVIVDDINDSIPPSTKPSPSPEQFLKGNELSFDLESLDPDLAALLSPHKYKFADSEPALLAAVNAVPPPSLSRSQSPESRPAESESSTPLNASTSSSIGRRSPSSTRRTLESHVPRRPTRNTTSTASSSSSSLPRPSRYSVSRLSPVFTDKALGPDSPSYIQSDPTIITDSTRRPSASSESGSRRKHPPSPLREAHPALEEQSKADDLSTQRRPNFISRYTTPSRPSTAIGSASASRSRHFPTVSVSGWDHDAISPSSRASSVMGTAGAWRPHHARPSMDNIGRGSFDRERITHIRTRRRSTSLGGNYLPPKLGAPGITRSATDWLGPRTQKAFAAAGLLDHEREGNSSVQGSRFGTVRSALSDRDSRSQYAPSRMAFSEISGSASSWGGLRVSSPDGQTRPPLDSPTFSNTTRAFSPSTAPTSLSAASSVHHQHQTEVETLKEKHAMEMEALLSALGDSQRTAKVLREENTQLRDRVSELELHMDELLGQLRRQRSAPPPAPPLVQHSRASSNIFSRIGSPDLASWRVQSMTSGLSSRARDRSPKEAIASTLEDTRDLSVPRLGKHRRRSSTTSSVFQLPPSNMSMLIHEEGEASDLSRAASLPSAPPSPTLVLPLGKSSTSASAQQRAKAAPGNVSPTSTSFSTMPGSPGSLNLRPEHEIHLEDLASFDLDHGFGEDDAFSLAEHP